MAFAKSNFHKRLCVTQGISLTDRELEHCWKPLLKRECNRKLSRMPIDVPEVEVTSKWSNNWLNPNSLVFFPEEIAFPVDREKPQPMAYAMGRFVNRYQPTVKVHSHA